MLKETRILKALHVVSASVERSESINELEENKIRTPMTKKEQFYSAHDLRRKRKNIYLELPS